MGFPYLLQVTSPDEEKPSLLYEVVVVTATNEWKRHYSSGVVEDSSKFGDAVKTVFSTPQKARDALSTGMTPYNVSLKENASQKEIDDALKKLKGQPSYKKSNNQKK